MDTTAPNTKKPELNMYEIEFLDSNLNTRKERIVEGQPIMNPILAARPKVLEDDDDVYYICKRLENRNYIIKRVSKNGEPLNVMENPGYHKDVYKQLCYGTKVIFQDELKEKCPKTVYQYGPLIDEYNELCESSSAKCVQLYQAANDEMSKAIKAYYQSYFDNFDETVAKLKQQYNI